MFLAGNMDDLLESQDGYSQLDGVLELLNFANSYVLSDRTAIGGAPVVETGEISRFLSEQAQQSEAIELIAHGSMGSLDLSPFEDRTRMDDLVKRAKESERSSAGYKQAFEEANILAARAYILLADANDAAYIPERLFGVRALEGYSEVAEHSAHLREHEKFRRQLTEKLNSSPDDISFVTRVPSFLVEALHEAQTWQGVFAALSDLRNSNAARYYRDLLRRSRSADPKERYEARDELSRASEASFKREGLTGSLDRWIVPTVGLSAAAVAVLFPHAAVFGGVATAIPPVFESIRRWHRNRHNLFEFYDRSMGPDLYDELMRVFPGIKFWRENLWHFLSKRDFGWSEDLHFWRRVQA
jgi:hypothetical protein